MSPPTLGVGLFFLPLPFTGEGGEGVLAKPAGGFKTHPYVGSGHFL
jgi:hypothetical protein